MLCIGLLLNIVIPVYAADTDPTVEGFWDNWTNKVDIVCSAMAVTEVVTVGAVCATGVGTVACAACAGWGMYRAVSGLLGGD